MLEHISSNVTAIVADKVSGKIKQKVNGSNMVMLAGLDISIQQVLSPNQPAPFQYIAIGGSIAPAFPPGGYTVTENDTGLDIELDIGRSDPVSDPTIFDTTGHGEVTYYNDSNDDIWVSFAGLFNTSGFETGDMLAKFKFSAPIRKNAGDTLTIIWGITIQPI